MKILVTGASGFSGSFIARRLAAAGNDVTAFHRSRSGFLDAIADARGVTLAAGELTSGGLPAGPFDAVVHAASTSPAPWLPIPPSHFLNDNINSTAALLSACRRWQTRAFILFSSVSVYGAISTPVVDEATPVVNPDAYGTSKLFSEMLLAELASELPGLALRLPGVLGAGAHRNWFSTVPSRLLAGETITAFNLDQAFNNAAHIADITDLISRVLARRWAGFDAVVLGAGGAMTARAAIERLAAGLGVEAHIEAAPTPKPSFVLSSERAVERWGYAPMEIGALIDRYAGEARQWVASRHQR